jgi:hypothetical protein
MDSNNFWDLVPIVDEKLWSRVKTRIGQPQTAFTKRMGMTNVQTAPLESFFDIKGVSQEKETLVTWHPKALVKTKSLTRVFDDFCEVCLSKDMRVLHSEGSIICGHCGSTASECYESPASMTETHGPSTTMGGKRSDKPRRVSQYIYKRCNHFKFWLSRVQGKETTGVKQGVVEAVRQELAKERIFTGDPRVTHDKVRAMLKKLRLTKYYNNAWLITSHLSGTKAPQLTPLQEEKLLSLFHAVQEPFSRHCPPDRVNMLSYSYLLRKMTEALGWHELSWVFPLLKSRQKVYQQDRVWERICADINLPFIRSIS